MSSLKMLSGYVVVSRGSLGARARSERARLLLDRRVYVFWQILELDPVRCVRRGFDDLRGDDQLLLKDEESGIVVMNSSVIRRRRQRDQLCRCKAIYAILAVLVGPHDY